MSRRLHRPPVSDALQGRCARSRSAESESDAQRLCTEIVRDVRAQRSNPESLRGRSLDCFAALAMTEQGAASPPPMHFNSQTRLRILAAHFARALLRRFTLLSKRAQGRPGAGWHPRSAARKAHAERTAQQHTGGANHSAFPARWLDGLCRALPGAEFVLASLALANSTTPSPVERDCRLRKGLTVATTARTTRFCRTHGSPFAAVSQPCRRSRKLQTRRSLAAPLVGTKPRAHGEQSALPMASHARTLPRPPQARLANMTTTRSPLKDEPGWATHTPSEFR